MADAGSAEDRGPGLATRAAAALAQAMAARLCHDLGGPLAGLAGALEVAQLDPEAREEALDIAREGSTRLAARLRLLRAAWAGGDEAAAGLAPLLAGLPDRVRAELDGLGTLPAPLARLALNLLLLGAESLPRGGVVRLLRDGAGLRATLEGVRAAWPTLPDTLDRTPNWAAIEPRGLQGPLTALAAEEAGMRLLAEGPLVLLVVPAG